MSDDLGLVKDLCRQIAQQPETLAMIRATRDWPRVGVHVGAYVIFEERPGRSTVVWLSSLGWWARTITTSAKRGQCR